MGATDRPFFRTDLVSRPVDDAGYRFIEVTDPDSGMSFRFYEVEYAIACAMDGERDLPGLADWAKIELGLETSPDELRTVIGTLEHLGYLDIGMRAETQPPPLDRPPPAGRMVAGPAPFDLPPPARPLPGQGPFDLETPPPFDAGDGDGRSFGEGVPVSPVSMDLSDHIPVRAADVKEAVRQSRAMHTVRPPEGVLRESADDESFDEDRTPGPIRSAERAPAAAAADAGSGRFAPPPPPPLPPGALGKTLLGTPSPVLQPGLPTRAPTPAPIVLPEQPAEFARQAQAIGEAPTAPAPPSRAVVPGWERGATSRQAAAHPAHPGHAAEMRAVPADLPRRAGSPLPYIIALLVLIGGSVGAYWWFFVREDRLGSEPRGAPPTAHSTVEQSQAEIPARAPSPPPSSEVTAALEAGPTEEREILAGQPGRVAWLAPAGSEVSEAAPVAKLEGFQKWEYAVKEAQLSQRRYQERLDQATAKGDKESMKEAESNVKRKQGDINRSATELEPFLIKAPIGGVVELAIKRGTIVKKDQPVAKILAQTTPRATFVLPPGTMYTNGWARVASKADPSLAATCKVESNSPGKLVVSCPTDSGLASGTEVVLKLQ